MLNKLRLKLLIKLRLKLNYLIIKLRNIRKRLKVDGNRAQFADFLPEIKLLQ